MNNKLEASMNLPIVDHIDRLNQLITDMRQQTDQTSKDLQILRGCVSQLSFINKQSDKDLNQYLINSINSMRQKWASQWQNQQQQLNSYHKKLNQINQGQEDIEIRREEFEEKVQIIQEMVGLI